ncbi:fibronectin type III domain-containing protein [Hymenobacter sp. ASUV-10]|uniref:Fibronectin type III domain-containing protein n=1 Tax=Hymenobacter aranciens TaxID=3063996 RepID=A0ABT9BAA1_9BACT|nr:fibronectin type III domain-containing protein [Hymenobacter sp. ASUV-10]MDO7875195.1 fibronectin type III domain-containing protein [Hymenobacter sp. ASUV-10]
MHSSTLQPGRRTRRWLLALAATLGLATAAQAQAPANDDPCGAVTLTPQGSLCTAPTVSTNLNATTTVPNGYGNTGNPRDVWFKFTTAATGPASFGATITVNGNPATFVQLFEATSCAGPFTPVAFSSSNQANTTAPRLVTGLLVPSTTYYVRVSGNPSFNDATGPFTICVSDGPGTATCAPISINSVTQTAPGTLAVVFTPGRNNVGPYTYRFTGNGGNPITGTTAGSPFTITGAPLGPYTLTISGSCPSGGQATGGTNSTLNVINDEACGAIQLPFSGATTCATPTTGNFGWATGSGFGAPTSSCFVGGTQAADDVWYRVTTTASGPGSTSLTLTLTGGGVAALRLLRGTNCSPNLLSEVSCMSGLGLPTVPPLTATGLSPSTTYYVQVVENENSPTSNFTLCATAPVSCAPPSNFRVGIATSNTLPIFFSPGLGNTSYTLTYTPLGGQTQTVTFTGLPYTLTNVQPGTPYTLTLTGNCSGGQVSTAVTTPGATLITNNEPCGATALTMSPACTPTAGTTTGATATPTNGYSSQGCGFGTSSDVWYTFTTAASGPASTAAVLTVGNGVSKQVRVFSAASCNGPFTQVACAASVPGTNATNQNPVPLLPLTGLLPGTTYYVSVGEGNYFGLPNFTICVAEPPACPNPGTPAIGSITATSASLNFTAPAGNTSYLVTTQAAGGAVSTLSPAPTAAPVALTGLQSGTSYTVTLQSVCPAGLGSVYTLTFRTLAANDECATATPIPSIGVSTCGTPVSSTNAGATGSTGVPAPTCASYSGADVWFSLVVPANGILQVETGAGTGTTMNDTGLALYSGTCGALTLLGCDDDSGTGAFSLLRRTGLVPGSTIYARVWGLGGRTGDFTICAQTDVSCPAVTNLAVSNLTSTSGTVSFTGPTNGTSYLVTYTPTGGTGTTITAPSSPVQLTGLTANTPYSVCVVADCGSGQQSVSTCVNFSTTEPCPAVTNLSVAATATATATLSFTPQTAATGGYTITLTPLAGGAPVVRTVSSYPVQLTSLVPNAGYSVSVVSNCGGGLSSAPATFSFLNTRYCTTGLSGSCSPAITNVRIATTTLNNTSTCAVVANNAYASFPATGSATASLLPGQSYQLSVTPTDASDLSAWFDYDHDGTFAPGEHIQVALGAAANLPAVYSFTVPTSATPGLVAMRIRSRIAGSQNGPTDACTSFATGEAEDYLLTILDPTGVRESALAAQVKLYPNPATTAATLLLPASLSQRSVVVSLYNSLGQQVRQQPLPARATEVQLDLGGLARGVYSLHLPTAAGLVVKRLVVE